MRALALSFVLLTARAQSLHILRLPWIFSDQPEIAADFNFAPADNGKTRVSLSLGGRFSRFGLPYGSARAPILDMNCEFVSPGELVSSVATLKGHVDLAEVLKTYSAVFTTKAFASSSPYVFKTEFSVALAPGDYNVIVSILDKELSISSRRTLHVIVPELKAEQGVGDLQFCLGVGEELDAQGKPRRVLDLNPWRQLGGLSGWDMVVAYNTMGPASAPGLRRRHSVWRLRGDNDQALWIEEAPLPRKKKGQLYLARLGGADLKKLTRGIYVFKVEVWSPERPAARWQGSKTFEVLP